MRGNRAGAHTLDSAFAKAYTAASFKTDTTALVERSKTVPVLANLFKLPHLLCDQHVSATPYYQNTPMLGRLLAEWGEAPAGCLFLLPLWHPVLVAEQIGTLAAIAQGPFIMQCGLGWGDTRFAAMGANIRTRPSAFEEALDIVRRLLAGETVSSSRRFRVAEASLDHMELEHWSLNIGKRLGQGREGRLQVPGDDERKGLWGLQQIGGGDRDGERSAGRLRNLHRLHIVVWIARHRGDP